MPKALLHLRQRNTGADQPGGERVPKIIEARVLLQPVALGQRDRTAPAALVEGALVH